MPALAWAVGIGAALWSGCGDSTAPPDTTSGLPPDDGGGGDGGGGDGGSADGGGGSGDGGDGGSGDGGDGGSGGGGPEPGDDEVPTHTLTLVQEGTWSLSPYPGPYESMSGELRVTELLDGDPAQPRCWAVFSLTGYVEADSCEGCQVAFRVTHYLAEDGGLTEEGEVIGGLAACMAPDLPAPDAQWTLGLASDDATIYRQTGPGGWVAWYDSSRRLDEVSFSWTGTVAVELDDGGEG